MSRMNKNRRRLEFDGLEGRRLLSGDVTASVNSSGYLTITGDGAGNQIALSRGYGNWVVVQSLDGSTRINGTTSPRYFLPGNDINIDLNSGDDVLIVNDIQTPADLHVWGDHGDDSITVNKATVRDDLRIYPGYGDDSVALNGVTVGLSNDQEVSNLEINDSGGIGPITIGAASDGTRTSVEYDVAIELGASVFLDAVVEIGATDVGDDLRVTVHPIWGEDSFWSDLHLDVSDVSVGDDLAVTSTVGNDQLDFDDVQARDLILQASGGNDSVSIEDTSVTSANVDLGNGNDGLGLLRMSATGSVVLDGGDGYDGLSIGNGAPSGLSHSGFESVFYYWILSP